MKPVGAARETGPWHASPWEREAGRGGKESSFPWVVSPRIDEGRQPEDCRFQGPCVALTFYTDGGDIVDFLSWAVPMKIYRYICIYIYISIQIWVAWGGDFRKLSK